MDATPTYDPNGFNIHSWRRRIPACERLVLMNNCSQTPQCDHTRMAAERYLESWSREVMDWDRWEEEVDALKKDFAAFINASPDEIATLTSVSEATAVLVSALTLKQRKRIVLTEAEFPCVAHIILAHGRYGLEPAWVSVRDEILHLEDYDRLIDESTLLVSATHAYYQNGYVQDIAAIAQKAHDKGAFIFVDAYQSAGVVPIDVKAMDIDFLATGTLKWMFGVPGIAFLYAKKELLPLLEPAHTGWFGRTDVFAFNPKLLDWHPTAKRLETGTWPVPAVYIARGGLQVVAEVGVDTIQAVTRPLSARLIERGRANGLKLYGTDDVTQKTPITSFLCPGDSHVAQDLMLKRGVIAPARGPVIRLAPHFYNTLEECDYAVDALADVYREPELLASTPRH
ncbi:MAG: aminotransferase class V-fold PLP-dependent enzyme [Actinobacteria bacterium]|nr:aminotransferase class V-fold PLP-dependent enzyme [Actinomycetota bacterium]